MQLGEVVAEVAIQGGSLVRIIAVAQVGVERQANAERLLRGLLLVEKGSNGRIVGARALEDLQGQPLTRAECGIASMLLHLSQHDLVIGRVADDGDPTVVLGC